MRARALNHPLDEVSEAELILLARAAEPLLAGRPLPSTGPRPSRLRAGRGYEFLDYRKYTLGDDLRTIDWRATARSRHPQVRRVRDETTCDWHICLDCSASMRIVEDRKWRLALQLAAALSYLLLHLGHRVGLLGFDQSCAVLSPAGRGRHHYARLARVLRAAAPRARGGASDLLQCARRLPPRHAALVISDFLAPDGMQAALRRLAASGHTVHAMHVFDAGEFAAPLDPRPAVLLDIETLEQKPCLPAGDAVQSARNALLALGDDLRRFCAGHGIRYTACAAQTRWKSAVMRHLTGPAPRHA